MLFLLLHYKGESRYTLNLNQIGDLILNVIKLFEQIRDTQCIRALRATPIAWSFFWHQWGSVRIWPGHALLHGILRAGVQLTSGCTPKFQRKRSVCIHMWLTGCSYVAIGSVVTLKLCNGALALGLAFKSSFDCQVSQHMGDARPAHSAHRGGAKHHCYMDFLKARGVFSWPNKPAVGQYPNIIAQSCSCIGRSRP